MDVTQQTILVLERCLRPSWEKSEAPILKKLKMGKFDNFNNIARGLFFLTISAHACEVTFFDNVACSYFFNDIVWFGSLQSGVIY